MLESFQKLNPEEVVMLLWPNWVGWKMRRPRGLQWVAGHLFLWTWFWEPFSLSYTWRQGVLRKMAAVYLQSTRLHVVPASTKQGGEIP